MGGRRLGVCERLPPLLERKVQDRVLPLIRVARFGNQFQVTHVLADRSSFGVAISQPGKLAPFALPSLRQGAKADVMRKDYAPERRSCFQQFVIGKPIGPLFRCRQNIYTTQAQLLGDGARNVRVHVDCDRH